MKTKSLLSLSLAVVMLAGFNACQSSDDEVATNLSPSENPVYSHTIPVLEALSSLDDFLKDGSTRANGMLPKVANVLPMKFDKVTTRAAASDVENVIYVANFDDDKGFAVLAADDRIEERIIAVTDKGNLTQADIDAVASFFKNKENYIDSDYPTTGEGLFTVEDYPDEVFLNPNTFSTYDETQDDNWVGTFSDEDGLPSTRATENHEYAHETSDGYDRRIALSYCLNYAMEDITEEDPTVDMPKDEEGRSSNNRASYTKTTFSNWQDYQRTNNLLSAYVGWHQRSPFNDQYPTRRKYILFGHKKKAPGGCFPLSLAKILTNFKKPQRFTYNGTTVDWNALNNVDSSQGKIAAATLVKGITEWCGSMYFYQGTFTFPSKASSFLKDMGYSNVKRLNYSYNRVTSMINSNCPVIIYAIPGIKIWNSHAWIIDGYKVKVRQKTTKQYKNGYLVSTTTVPDTCRMVHCDFGWQGRCNGYYVDGVFKLNSKDNDYDYPWLNGKKEKYNHHIRVITYSN